MDASINPAAVEIANNDVDEDCNGIVLINSSIIVDIEESKISDFPNLFNQTLIISQNRKALFYLLQLWMHLAKK